MRRWVVGARMRRFVVLASLVAGCSDGSAVPDAAADAPACTALGECEWLDGYQRRIVSQLGGGSEISPGVTLRNRYVMFARDAARAYLLDELRALGLTAERHDYTQGSYSGANVIATLPATAPSADARPIVVGAHFDGVQEGPGAGDNATGVAIVLAAARYLSAVPGRTRPVEFVLFDQEELGLIGSKAYVATLEAQGRMLRGAHIFDMLSFDGDGDRAVELWSPTPELEALYRSHGPAAGTPIQPVAFESSDHQAFLDRGFPAVGIGEEFVGGDHTPHYHEATDTVDNVSFDHLAVVTHLALAVLAADATAP